MSNALMRPSRQEFVESLSQSGESQILLLLRHERNKDAIFYAFYRRFDDSPSLVLREGTGERLRGHAIRLFGQLKRLQHDQWASLDCLTGSELAERVQYRLEIDDAIALDDEEQRMLVIGLQANDLRRIADDWGLWSQAAPADSGQSQPSREGTA